MRNLVEIEQNWHPLCNDYQIEIPTEHPVICMVHKKTKEHDCYTLHYKGFDFSPTVHQLRESSCWELRVAITKSGDYESKILERTLSTMNIFPSIEEVVEEAILFGQQIIDSEFIGICILLGRFRIRLSNQHLICNTQGQKGWASGFHGSKTGG